MHCTFLFDSQSFSSIGAYMTENGLDERRGMNISRFVRPTKMCTHGPMYNLHSELQDDSIITNTLNFIALGTAVRTCTGPFTASQTFVDFPKFAVA